MSGRLRQNLYVIVVGPGAHLVEIHLNSEVASTTSSLTPEYHHDDRSFTSKPTMTPRGSSSIANIGDAAFDIIVLNNTLDEAFSFLWRAARRRVCADGGANRVYDHLYGDSKPHSSTGNNTRTAADAVNADPDLESPPLGGRFDHTLAALIHLASRHAHAAAVAARATAMDPSVSPKPRRGAVAVIARDTRSGERQRHARIGSCAK